MQSHKDVGARLESFRAQKLCWLESFRVLKLSYFEIFRALKLTRLLGSRALKLTRLERFRALKMTKRLKIFYGPKTLQYGDENFLILRKTIRTT